MRAVCVAVGTGAVRDEPRAVTMGLFDTLDLPGNRVECFIPSNPLEFAFTAPADPFHGVLEPIGVILAAKISLAAGAGKQPWIVRAVMSPVVGVKANYHTIFDVGNQQTATATIVSRAAGSHNTRAITVCWLLLQPGSLNR